MNERAVPSRVAMTVQPKQDPGSTEERRYRRILVGYDGSQNADRALSRAASMAKEQDASLRIVYVLNVPMLASAPFAPPIPQGIFDGLTKDGKEIVSRAIRAVSSMAPQASGSLEVGYPAATILDIATTDGCDLIVLGRRGASRMERFLLGSVATSVTSHSHCDVLIVE
jgi:nucleotide-binding universal stress UspA family protein